MKNFKILLIFLLLYPAIVKPQATLTTMITFSTLEDSTINTAYVDTIYPISLAQFLGTGTASPQYNLNKRDSVAATATAIVTQITPGIWPSTGSSIYITERGLLQWSIEDLQDGAVLDSARLRIYKFWSLDSTASDTTTTYGLIKGTYSTVDTSDHAQYNDFHGWTSDTTVAYTPAWLTEEKSFSTTMAPVWSTFNFTSTGLDSLESVIGDTLNTVLVGGNDMRRVAPPTSKDYSMNASFSSSTTWHIVIYSNKETRVQSSDTLKLNPVRAIWPDSINRMWWGTSMGVYRQSADTISAWYVYDDSLFTQKSRNNILTGIGLPNGNIYTGSLIGLTLHVDMSFVSDSLITESAIPDSIVFALAADSGGINQFWGAGGSKLWVYNDSLVVTYTTDSGLAGSEVYDIAIDSVGSVWFATNKGVSRLWEGFWITYIITNADSNSIRSIAVAAYDSSIWFGGDDGLVQFDGDTTWTEWTNSLPSTRVRDVIYCQWTQNHGIRETIWAATDSGLAAYGYVDTATVKTWRHYTPASTNDSLPNFNLFSVVADTAGRVWIGHSTGVTRLSEN